MIQESKFHKPPKVRIPRPRVLWPLLLLLASFVLFFEFIADVGGSDIRAPTATPSPTAEPSSVPNDATTAQMIEVVDGDTVLILAEDETFRVRYYGIDTPERGERCFGQATEANRQLVEGQAVRLLASARDADEYGRLLRYVFLEDGQSVEASLVAQGLAGGQLLSGTTSSALRRRSRPKGRAVSVPADGYSTDSSSNTSFPLS